MSKVLALVVAFSCFATGCKVRINGSLVKSSSEEELLSVDQPNLKNLFFDAWSNLPMDILEDRSFTDYLEANEKNPIQLAQHMSRAKSPGGLLLSVGTERSFYGILSCELCSGLVVRDINPRVKAYVDMNILLLTLSNSREDYLNLSEPIFSKNSSPRVRLETTRRGPKRDQFRFDLYKQAMKNSGDRQVSILKLINDSHELTLFEKNYYRDNLQVLSAVFFSTIPQKIDGGSVDYRTNDRAFEDLKKRISAGEIIATVGPIDDLSLFSSRAKISVVDESNVSDYTALNFGSLATDTRIIWTTAGSGGLSTYRSYDFKEASEAELEKYQDLYTRAMDLHRRDVPENLQKIMTLYTSVKRLFIKMNRGLEFYSAPMNRFTDANLVRMLGILSKNPLGAP